MNSIKNKIVAAYEELAEHYDRPNTLAMLPEVAGKTILDAACGPGKYAEILLSQGASVTGFDISPKMVHLAKQRNGLQGDFFVHDFSQPLTQLEDQSFDMVLCALALHYVEDWSVTIREFYRVLKSRGILVLSIEHPFYEYTFFRSEQYFSVENVQCIWRGFGIPVEVNSFRRPLEACLGPLTDHGFYIDKLVEPKPTAEFANYDPKHFQELNQFPAFLCIRAIKKN